MNNPKVSLVLDGKSYTLEDLSSLLGRPIKSAALSLSISGKEFIAKATGLISAIPAMEVCINAPGISRRPLFRVERDIPEFPDNDEPFRSYFYGLGDSYIAYMDIDTRPDEVTREDPASDRIVVGGNGPGQELSVEVENPYTHVLVPKA